MTDSFEEAKAFWGAVAKPMDWSELKVGTILLLEDHGYGHGKRPVIVLAISRDEDGVPTFTFRDATVEEAETMETPYPILVAGGKTQ
jgi:hypothetical protein